MHKVLHCQNTITTSCGYEQPPRVSGEIGIKGVADETGVATTALGGVPILRV